MPMNAYQKLAHKNAKRLIDARVKKHGVKKKTAVRDLLTDIRHFCEKENVNFHAAAKGAYDIYLKERAETT